jgi:hypothetical protein
VYDRSPIIYSSLIGVVPGRILNLLITADIVPLATISPNFMPATYTGAVSGQYQRSLQYGWTIYADNSVHFFCGKLNYVQYSYFI